MLSRRCRGSIARSGGDAASVSAILPPGNIESDKVPTLCQIKICLCGVNKRRATIACYQTPYKGKPYAFQKNESVTDPSWQHHLNPYLLALPRSASPFQFERYSTSCAMSFTSSVVALLALVPQALGHGYTYRITADNTMLVANYLDFQPTHTHIKNWS